MESIVYLNTLTQTAHAALTGHALPKVLARLQAHLQVDVHPFETGEEPALLSSPTFRIALKATPTGAPFVFTSTVTDTLADGYRFSFASVDAAALRTYLGDSKEPKEAFLEIEWTVASVTERVTIPALIENAYIRTDEEAPTPGSDEAEAWLDARAVRHDQAQTLTGAQMIQALANQGITITEGGYLQLENADGDLFHIGLNSGSAPS